jgi:histidyl-tRNA synthetase
MTKITPQTLKGFRDFLPDEAIIRSYVISKIKAVFETFGFDPLETPALEYSETLLGKYGEEADKLLYLFEDRGKRKVGLRYDQTVPLARIIAQYQNLPKPFKRYQIQSVWRAENPQKGRYREFLQCDIDIVGEEKIYADAEIITCAITTVRRLGFENVTMLINDRSIFAGVDNKYIIALDKLAKIGRENVIKELIKKGMSETEANKFMSDFEKKQPTPLLKELFKTLEDRGLKREVDFEFVPTLARGLDYYTGTIFELICQDYQAGSIGGGGRYDKLIGQFTGSDIAAVGFAFGFDRLIEAMKELKLIVKKNTNTKVLVTIFSPDLLKKSNEIATILRNNNINTDIVLDPTLKLDKQLKYADRKGIPYVVIIGSEEAAKNYVTLKNMKTREQITFDKLDQLIEYVNQS